ncbi:MAG: response regulator [Alphaproteobacteria bacterium]|nr:response regulator [Alphaproteobacteria bacterium]
MQIISQSSENHLLQDLRSLWQNNTQYRCLQFKFSQTEKYNDEWPDLISAELTLFFEDVFLDVYVCKDHDIFIINRTMTHKRVAQFLTHLGPKLGPARDEISGLASLYEIGIDWAILRSICEKKIDTIRLERYIAKQGKESKHHKDDINTEEKSQTIKEANEEMVLSLPRRRKNRKVTEILVVEDDPLSQRLIGNALKDTHSYTIIGEGKKACMTYLIKAPDILFLDIGLPDISGHEVLKSIFEIDPEAYVVMFSGNGDKENVLKAIDVGAKGFLGKPFTLDKLMQYIEKSPHIKGK